MRATLLALLGALALGVGCTAEQKPPEPPPPAPQIESFTVTPAEVSAGEKVKLEWKTTNATSVELQQVGKGVVSGADGLSGSVELTVQEDSLFVLTAKNARGVAESAAATVDVIEATNEVIFVATPKSVDAGQPVTLAWSAAGAKTVTLAVKDGAPIDIGSQTQSGSVSVTPSRDTQWVLTVDGKPYEASVEVRPTVDAFVVSPSAVKPGEMVTVSWKTSGAAKAIVSLAGTGEIGSETDAAKVADGTLPFAVPADIDPAAALTFSIVAEKANGSASATASVTAYVAGAPKVRKVTVPQYARVNDLFDVSWETTGADKVQVLQDGAVVYETPTFGLADKGTVHLAALEQDTVVKVRALNSRGGQDESDAFTVDPVGIPTLMFTATTNSIAHGGEAVTLTWNVKFARNLKIVALNQYPVLTRTGPAAETGSIDVYPNKDTEYVLTADNGIGDSVSGTTGPVTVANPAHLVFSPALTPAGTMIQLVGTTVSNAGAMRALNFPVKNAPGDAFIDISTTGATLPFASGDDTVSKLIQLAQPLQTTFFGMPVGGSSISVSINGWAVFSPTTISGSSVPSTTLPTTSYEPFALIPYGKDLQAGSATKVYWKDEGTGPARRVIIQWNDVEYYNAPGKKVTFQAQIYADGHVVFAYSALAGLSASDKPAIGIINQDETGAAKPFTSQLNGGLPNAGDTFSFFSIAPLPFSFPSSSTPLDTEFEVGTGTIRISDAPGIIPPGQFVVSEVNHNPAPGHGEWIELLNLTSSPIDLNGWEIDFGNGSKHTIATPLTLPGNGRLVLGQDSAAAEDGTPGGAAVDYVYGPTYSMADGAGSVSIGIAGDAYTTMSWPAGRPQGVAYQLGLQSSAATYLNANVRLPCGANQVYGASAQKGTPGQPNTACYPYAKSMGTPNAFFPLATSPGSQVVGALAGSSNTDSKLETLTLPRPVPFFGKLYSTLYVSSNGFVATSATSSYTTNDATLSSSDPNGVLALFWDDLDGNTNGAVRWQQFDPDGVPGSGDEYTIVSWEDWKVYGTTSSLNFQVVFFEGTGDIEYRYGNMTSSDTGGIRAMGSEATTWLEDPDGTSALIQNVNSSSNPGIAPNTTIHFTAQ